MNAIRRSKENYIDQDYLTFRINKASEAENTERAKEEKKQGFTANAETEKETDLLYRLDYVSRIENGQYRQQEAQEVYRKQMNANKIADFRRDKAIRAGRQYEQ